MDPEHGGKDASTAPTGRRRPAATGPAAQGLNPTLYSGTPGVVLFFLELHRATGRAEDLQDARAGADHLLATLDDKPQSGLYTGVAGVGFVLGEVYKATNDAKYRDGMRKSVEILQRTAIEKGAGVEWTPVTDIISGTAGTGLPAACREGAEHAGREGSRRPCRTTPDRTGSDGSGRDQVADESRAWRA